MYIYTVYIYFACKLYIQSNREARVDSESVNGIIVDDEPQSRLDRLLVSLCVSINKRSDTVTLHETALLPNIPALPAAMILIFTPFVELR